MGMWSIGTSSVEETRALGKALGACADVGTVVALVGELGAGKTCFCQGVGAGLGILQPVLSPTFVLIAEYPGGRLPLLHADNYRLRPGEEEGIGLEERLEQWPGVALVEWADRFDQLLPEDHLRVVIAHAGVDRTVSVRGTGPKHAALLDTWRCAVFAE